MYIVYEEHIEQLEEENGELQKEVIALRRRIKYYQTVMQEDRE
jgi:cell division protein FtsB